MKVAIFANTLSASFIFRASLIEELKKKGLLGPICAVKHDICGSNGSSGSESTECCFDKNYVGSLAGLISDQVSVIHSFTHLANVIACLIAFVFRKKLILTVTGMGALFGRNGISGFVGRNLIRWFYFCAQFVSRVIIVQNKDDYREIEKLLLPFSGCTLCITAGSGIPIDYFSDVPVGSELRSNKTTVGFFSRALPQKGVWSFFELASMHKESDDLRFIHGGHPGTGDLGPESILSTAKRNNVSYLGHTQDIRPWLLITDIVVIPSGYREGLSRLLIESMLAGKIVVAKDTTGVRDHLENGVNGFVYTSDSELPKLFEVALSVLGGSISANAKDYAQTYFDTSLVNEIYFNAYNFCGLRV